MVCAVYCDSIDELVKHLIARSKTNGSYVLCPPENKSIPDPMHVKSHLPGTLACYLKDADLGCSYTTHDPALLEIHESSHEGITQFTFQKFKCTTCGVKLASPWSLKTHEAIRKYDRKTYICIDCNKVIMTPQGLEIHRRSSCPVLLARRV
jgi:hypothetical protein